MEKDFELAYRQLNAAQKKAVDTIEGPVLVVAGPGTGKTQLLSLRVAQILQKTDTDSSNILCLTFTNFAATNMRDRLSRLVGPAAHSVMVRTFHSFAAEIMNLYPDYFWNGARLSIAPDAAQLEIIQDVLSELPLDNPLALKFAGVYSSIDDVQQALKLTKEAGLTPEKLAALVSVNDAYIDVIEPLLVEVLSPPLSVKKLPQLQLAVEALPDQPIDETVTPLASLSTVLKDGLRTAIVRDQATGKTTATGKWKRFWLQSVQGQKGMFDEKRRNSWWQTVASVYASYRDILHGRGYYDYSDMIIEVITQLEQYPQLLASVQERFLYLLVDEFQDTNAAQLRLCHLVATHYSSDGKPNLMAVGDDDQSIFAFNGAELNNMLAFRKTYPTTTTIILEENYRSSQDILDAAGGIIAMAEDRLVNRETDLNKRLHAANKQDKGSIEHLSYPTREHQLSAIAQRIKQTWQAGDTHSVAVLARNHDSLRQLSGLLSAINVPIRYEQQNNVLNQPLIQQVCLLSEIIVAIVEGDEASVNHGLAKLLAHPAWQISPKNLWKLASTNYKNPQWLDSLLNHDNEQLVALGNWLLWLAQHAASDPLPVILEYLVGLRAGSHLTSPLREYYITSKRLDNIYLEALSGLQVLRDITAEFAAVRAADTSLTDFVRFINLHRELGRPITDQSWFMSAVQSVQLLTVHKAKGLEFDTVFVLDAIEDIWSPRHIGRKPPANLPLQPYGEQYDDYVRLLYVAATRAKHSLIVSSFYTDVLGRNLLPTPLISHLKTNNVSDNELEDPISVLESGLAWPRLENKDERTLMQTRLENYQLSATGLLQFLDVTSGGPKQFLERQLLRLPEITTAAMAYGTAIHKALQTAQQLTTSHNFNLLTVLDSYSDSLHQQSLPKAEIERYQLHGRQTLEELFTKKGFTLQPSGQAEIAINNLQIGAARLSGKLDRVDLSGNEILITDYKTGRPLNSFATRDQTKAVKAWRHRTQLLFYALIARSSGHFTSAKAIKAQMTYVEAETARDLNLLLESDEANLLRLEQLVTAVWQHLVDWNLPDINHYPTTIAGINAFEDDLINGNV